MNTKPFTYLFLILLKFCYSKLSDQCIKSNSLWNSLKYSYNDSLKSSTTQLSMFACPLGSLSNCCQSNTNQDMIGVSQLRLTAFAEDRVETILMILSNDSYYLMDRFVKNLETTKNNLHQLFSATYGYNYKVHKNFFFTWFDQLQQYMTGQRHNISLLLDNFFLEMAQTIVKMIVTSDSTADTAACHTSRLLESRPYQDTDVLLKKRIIRSYPPARLFVNGIAVGRDVFNELMNKTSPTKHCIEQFNTVLHCMFCHGLTLKPCPYRCSAIMDNCFGSFTSSEIKRLDKAFTKYLKTLIQLADRLNNPFNFPEVNNKMNVQISTAIMNIQMVYPTIRKQIKIKCQGTTTGATRAVQFRKSRQASQEFYNWQNMNSNQPQRFREQASTRTMSEEEVNRRELQKYQNLPSDSLSPVIRRMKIKYKSLENYFQHHISEYCKSVTVTEPSGECWNGTGVTKNVSPTSNKKSNKKKDKATTTTTTTDPIMKAALDKLSDITKRINSYLSDQNSDPHTMPVREYRYYTPRKIRNTHVEINPQSIFSQKIDGSGELDDNQPQPPNDKSKNERPSQPVSPQKPDKTNWEFPTVSEGSGETENKQAGRSTGQNRNLVTITPTSTKSLAQVAVMRGTRTSVNNMNQIPDDEDLNPPTHEIMPKVYLPIASISTIIPVYQPEGSGNLSMMPDLTPNKPAILTPMSTGKPSEPVIDGSGEDKSKAPIDKPQPFLPMLPDSQKSSTKSQKRYDKKPDTPPDEEVLSVDGSGKSPTQSPNQSTRRVLKLESTKHSVVSSSAEQYPGRVPSEVWLPGLRGAKDKQISNQKTTPAGMAASIHTVNIMKIVCQAITSLFLIHLTR